MGPVNDAENASQPPAGDQPLEDRVNNRSQRPESDAFKDFMASHWAPSALVPLSRQPWPPTPRAAAGPFPTSSKANAWSFRPVP